MYSRKMKEMIYYKQNTKLEKERRELDGRKKRNITEFY